MKKHTVIALFLAVLLLLSLSSCFLLTPKKALRPERTTEAAQTSFVYTTVPDAAADGEPDLGPFTFDAENAEYLGTIKSEIYEKLHIYYQDDRIVIFSDYGAQLFTLYAYGYVPNYEDTPIELIGDDVNFDGHIDFYLLYSQANLNSYYFFWIWDMEKHTFRYYLPLSSVPSPELDKNRKRILSNDKTAVNTLVTTEYIWQNGDILPVAHGEKTIDPDNTASTRTRGPEDVDTSVSILTGHIISTVTMKVNKNTNSRWLCKIEDEKIVKLYSETLDPQTLTDKFSFRGYKPGTTTVVLRYATTWNAPYVAQKILNITVNTDLTLNVLIVE